MGEGVRVTVGVLLGLTVAVAELAGFLLGVLVTAGWFGMVAALVCVTIAGGKELSVGCGDDTAAVPAGISDRIAAASVGVDISPDN